MAVAAAAAGGGADVGAGSSRKATSVSGGAGSGTHRDVEEFAAAGRPLITVEVAEAVDFVRTNVVNSRDVGSVAAATAAAASVDSFQGMAMPLTVPVGTNFAAAVVVNYSRCCCLFDNRLYLDWVSWVVQPASAVVPLRRGPNPVSGAGLPRTPVCVGQAI